MQSIWAGLATAIATTLIAPAVIRLLLKLQFLDQPNRRSSHLIPTPRGGGLACLMGLAVGISVAHVAGQNIPWKISFAALAMALIGFVDDLLNLSAPIRLTSQLSIGSLLGLALGGLPWAFIGAMTTVLIVNVVNFMDGINGITALTMALWGVTLVIGGSTHSAPTVALIGALTAGSALGFLPWNLPQAKIFLGDVGSYLFGMLCAGGLVMGSVAALPPALLLAPISILLLDVLYTLGRRFIDGENLFTAHRDHIYQRLVHNCKLTHLSAAAVAVGGALLVTIIQGYGPGWLQAVVIPFVLILYVASPRLLKNASAPTSTTQDPGTLRHDDGPIP